jgi:DNA-binding response OmpR family regulator
MDKRILAVDDEEAILFNLKTYFRRIGFQVDCARDLDAAEQLLRDNEYGLLIADIRLSGTDSSEGMELVSYAKRLRCVPRIIVLTAYGNHETTQEALHRGADLLLQKPQPLAKIAHIAMALIANSHPSSSNALLTDRAHAKEGEEMHQKKVLLVDDSKTTLLMHQMILSKRTPYAVVTAADGQEAVEIAKMETPDLIVMDVVMPRMTGLEACKELRSCNETRNIPIILVTTRGEEFSVQSGFESGCNDYVTKPVDPAVLVELLDSYLTC